MKKRFFLTIITINLLISSLLFGNELVNKVHSALERHFGSQIKIEYFKFKIDDNLRKQIEKECGQRFSQNFVHVFKSVKNDSTVGYGIVDNVYGKLKPITFLVVFNNNGDIIDTEILKYRESYGGAVKNKNWLNQFVGKDPEKINFGKEIHGISGATISAKSVTKGIKKLSMLFEIIRRKND